MYVTSRKHNITLSTSLDTFTIQVLYDDAESLFEAVSPITSVFGIYEAFVETLFQNDYTLPECAELGNS